MAIKIITDSTCDIARETVDQFGISVVPAYVLFGEESFRQGIDINPSQFYARLQSSAQLPSTSQPTPRDFTEAMEPLVTAGDQVVCITVPKELSGTYNSAMQAASQFEDGAITVIDAGTASVGHMLQVIAAAEDAAAPDATLDSVVSAAQTRAGRSYGFAMVDTLEYLQKGGRIGKAQAFMGSLLKVKPILKVANGEVLPVDRPRNLRRGLQRLEELVREQGPASKLAVAYTTDAAPAEEMRNRLSDLADPENTYTLRVGSAIGTHVGPGAVAISTLP
ncbi:MAG: DegV family protein [Chloroflexota bacterium]|nr:DegV family protein [Chloroflexota bacterium]MDE2958821.1 DegV family protein [Chloroflexota bacterium]